MAYEYIPEMIIGIVLIVVGVRLNGDAPIVTLVRLALIIIGIVVFAYGLFTMFAQIQG